MSSNRRSSADLAGNEMTQVANSAETRVTRRQFVKTATAAGGALVLGSAGSLFAKSNPLPKPNKSGIDHIVLVTMENRSFDHFLGWLPGANGMQAGLSYTDSAGNTYPTYALRPITRGAGMRIPIILIPGEGFSTITASATGGCAPAPPGTPSPSATTCSRIWLSWARPLPAGRRATAISPRSWPKRFPTASTSTPRKPIASPIPPRSRRCPRSGTG